MLLNYIFVHLQRLVRAGKRPGDSTAFDKEVKEPFEWQQCQSTSGLQPMKFDSVSSHQELSSSWQESLSFYSQSSKEAPIGDNPLINERKPDIICPWKMCSKSWFSFKAVDATLDLSMLRRTLIHILSLLYFLKISEWTTWNRETRWWFTRAFMYW